MEKRPSEVIADVVHLLHDEHRDSRGMFVETFRASWFPEQRFIQGNLSVSHPGVLRGLHYHLTQSDLWSVPSGLTTVALVDLREASPSYLAIESSPLSGGSSVYIPPGVAHGFYAETEVLMTYLVTSYYDGSDEYGVAWDDPDLAVDWAMSEPILSERDRNQPVWSEVGAADRP